MATSTPSPRIGDAERAAAQRALQIHLDAGRLQVTEFVERFAGVAEAVTAADVAALFADLPDPHPPLPGRPPARSRRLVAVAVAALALTGILGFVIGRQWTGPPAPVVVAAPPPPFGPLTSPAGPGAPTPDPRVLLPEDATVRRSTGPGLITLGPSDGVDLDDLNGPVWNVSTGCCGHDVVFGADSGRLFITDGHAAVTGPLGFATCFGEPAYTDAPIRRESLQAGETFCVRTNGQRLALVTIIEVSTQAVEFGATVWDPPLPS